MTPSRIAHYEIVCRLGHGGMGTVYLGRDPDLDRSVAIKVLREPLAEDELLQRFLREARATASLRHENLVTIYQVGEDEHQPFIAMEYVDGTTLAEIIKRRQSLPLAQKLSFIEQICAGLHHAHRVGIVHRDIKPANVMVDSQDVIRILDFGIARVANSGMTSDGVMIGTLNYMSPEQMIGRTVDYRSDIFSVGAVAYELLSYHQSFPGAIDDGLLQRLPHEDPARLTEVCPGLPRELEAIISRALAKRPDDRFSNLDEMRVAVRHVRRDMDPHLEVETILVPAKGRPKSSARPASSEERRGLLERRARQIAVHRDAARAAFTRGDLEGAKSACEDALTLDPDDADASQLLSEIQQEKERRDQDSRARRDRERTMRQHLADAEVTLVRGDVATAARLLEQAFGDETRDPAALTLLAKVREAATTTGVVLSDTLNAVVERQRGEPTSDSPRSTGETDSRVGRMYVIAAAAVIVLAIGGAMLWMRGGGKTEAPALATSTTTGSSPAAPVAGDGNRTVPVPGEQSDPTVGSGSVAIPPPAAVAPAAASSPGTVDALVEPLARITKLYRSGNLPVAIEELERIGPSTDSRVTALARAVAQAALRSMDAALVAANSQEAADLAPAPYRSAEQSRSLAAAALNRNDYVHSGTQALDAADAYRRAESAARTAAATAAAATTVKPPPSAAPTPAPASPSPASAPPASSLRAETAPPPRAEPPAVVAPAAAAVVPRNSAIEEERSGIVRAMNRYSDGYSNRDVKVIGEVYPSLPRETKQTLEKQFKDCRSADLSFGNMVIALAADDSTAATVTVRATYSCTPKVGKGQVSSVEQGVFILRKADGVWFIDGIPAMDRAQRR